MTDTTSDKNMDLMRLMYWNHSKFKDISISKRQVKLIAYLKNKNVTSRDIASKYNIVVQNASQQLNNLYRKGYLVREEIEDKTGGYLFVYTSNKRLFDHVF